MPSDKDIVVEAREFAFSVNDDAPIGLRGKGLLRALADEVEARRSEVKTLELTIEGLLVRLGYRNED